LKDFQQTHVFRFVKGIADGEFRDHALLSGFMKAAVDIESKKRRGVGLQNMQYDPLVVQVAGMIRTMSPKTHAFLHKTGVHMPNERTLRYVGFLTGLYCGF
jgi:hypothetical protein